MNWSTANSYTGSWTTNSAGVQATGTLSGRVNPVSTARPLNLELALFTDCGATAQMFMLQLDESRIQVPNQSLGYPTFTAASDTCIGQRRLPTSGTLGTLNKQ